MRILGIIPSRYSSTRFPGKPLTMINGKSMINRVYDQATKSSALSKVVVATDDMRIYDHVTEFGGEVTMTSNKHVNGTARCSEVLKTLSLQGDKFDIVVNIQGDEPFIDPSNIDMVSSLFSDGKTEIGTLVKVIHKYDELFNPNVVKAIIDNNSFAIYFSRQPIPFLRDADKNNWTNKFNYFKHIGIYAYRTPTLNTIVELPIGKLEEAESLEQLRWIENGIKIKVNITDFESIGIDTPDDLTKLETKS